MLYRKKNRSGNCITVGLFNAYDRLINDYSESLDPVIKTNLEGLVEFRDNAVHFFNKGLPFEMAFHEIGTGTVSSSCTCSYVEVRYNTTLALVAGCQWLRTLHPSSPL